MKDKFKFEEYFLNAGFFDDNTHENKIKYWWLDIREIQNK